MQCKWISSSFNVYEIYVVSFHLTLSSAASSFLKCRGFLRGLGVAVSNFSDTHWSWGWILINLKSSQVFVFWCQWINSTTSLWLHQTDKVQFPPKYFWIQTVCVGRSRRGSTRTRRNLIVPSTATPLESTWSGAGSTLSWCLFEKKCSEYLDVSYYCAGWNLCLIAFLPLVRWILI